MQKLLKKMMPLSISAILLISSVSCAFAEKKVMADELSKSYTRAVTERGEVNDAFQTGIANFAFSLFRETATKDEKNDLISPLSAALCLALINNGASGNTRAEIESLFGMDTHTLNSSLYAYMGSLYSGKDCKLSLANSIWMKENALNVNPDFLQTNADWFNAQVYSAPFDSTTLQDVNNWCYNHTNGKIDKILDEISPRAVMYLINALDFDAKWQTKYETSDVFKQSFYNYDESEVSVTMLKSKEHIYLSDGEALGFAKPYKGDEYSFVALLPNEGVDVYDYVNTLNAERWSALWENREYPTVYARMPEFEYECDISLNETLQKLGASDMFSPFDADFSGMDATQQLYCEVVKQKTFIQLDRNGTKMAAVTFGGVGMTAAPPNDVYITLDRPFVYAIVDNEYHLPLCLGVISHL